MILPRDSALVAGLVLFAAAPATALDAKPAPMWGFLGTDLGDTARGVLNVQAAKVVADVFWLGAGVGAGSPPGMALYRVETRKVSALGGWHWLGDAARGLGVALELARTSRSGVGTDLTASGIQVTAFVGPSGRWTSSGGRATVGLACGASFWWADTAVRFRDDLAVNAFGSGVDPACRLSAGLGL